jgi:beta-phosphoglucomutase family hydrolase
MTAVVAPVTRDRGLRLPAAIEACLFDLDGVLTDTARTHAAAWKAMFDEFLRARSHAEGAPFVPFDAVRDYDEYVDGRQRYDGVRTFLAARGIALPEGTHADPPDANTVGGLGNRKNELALQLMRRGGVAVFESSIGFVRRAKRTGLKTAVVSGSANCGEVLAAAGIATLFDVRVDGAVAEREHLPGKPAPDTYLAAARLLGVAPQHAAVFEDALSGVAAGRTGHFGFVVGVDRHGQAADLRRSGADVVVHDLAELLSP